MNIRRGRTALLAALGAAAVLGASACQPVAGDKVALRQPAAAPKVWDISDPSVVTTGGKSYIFGSANNMNVPVKEFNPDTVTVANSHAVAEAMPTKPAWSNTSQQIWAPTVGYAYGKWTMWFAAVHKTVTDPDNSRCIGVAQSTGGVTGPYVPAASPIYCGLPKEAASQYNGWKASNPWGRGSLDPEFFRDPKTNAGYLMVTLSRTKDNIGILKLTSATTVAGGVNATPTTLASQSLDFHDGVEGNGMQPSAFLENPSMVYDPASQTYLLFYSAGQWMTPNYVTGFARCSAPTGPCTLDKRGPFLKNSTTRTGIGGLTVFKDAQGRNRVAYSSWIKGKENQVIADGTQSRQASIQHLTIQGSDPKTQVVKLQG